MLFDVILDVLVESHLLRVTKPLELDLRRTGAPFALEKARTEDAALLPLHSEAVDRVEGWIVTTGGG